jgi:hypothetical protein
MNKVVNRAKIVGSILEKDHSLFPKRLDFIFNNNNKLLKVHVKSLRSPVLSFYITKERVSSGSSIGPSLKVSRFWGDWNLSQQSSREANPSKKL